jgi:hypothetical protein
MPQSSIGIRKIAKGAVSVAAQLELRKAGFTNDEVETFNKAMRPDKVTPQKQINIMDDVWREVIRERKERVARMKSNYADKHHGKQMTDRQISREFNLWYVRRKTRNPFDWIKKAYRRLHQMTRKSLLQAERRTQDAPGNRPYKANRKYTVKANFD